MRDTIRNFLGGVSAIGALICFGLSSTYKMLLGKLGIGGLLIYLLIISIMLCLIYFVKGIRVPERCQFFVVAALFLVMCVISAELDKRVPGKSDALSIISYGLFATWSLCASRMSELGFETGGFTFFGSLFLVQTYKTNLKLFPIAVIFFLVMFVLRHGSQSTSPNGDHDISDEESLLPPSNQENNSEESSQAAHHSPNYNGGVSEEIIIEVVEDNQQNNDQEETHSPFPATRRHSRRNYGQVSEANREETRSYFSAESSHSAEQDHVSPANYQNGYVHSYPSRQFLRSFSKNPYIFLHRCLCSIFRVMAMIIHAVN